MINIYDGKTHMVTTDGKQTRVDGEVFFTPSRVASAVRLALHTTPS